MVSQKRVLAVASGIVSFVIFLLSAEIQIAAYMLGGLVFGATSASNGLRQCLEGVITDAVIGVILFARDQMLLTQTTYGSSTVGLMVATFRIAFPATIYYGVRSVPGFAHEATGQSGQAEHRYGRDPLRPKFRDSLTERTVQRKGAPPEPMFVMGCASVVRLYLKGNEVVPCLQSPYV